MRIAQIIQENYNDNKAPNSDLEALELKETEKLIDNIMSMQIRITEEADAISKDDSKTADAVDDSGTLGVYPTPMRTFTLAKDQSTGVTPQDHTADGISPSKKLEIKHRDPPSILIKSNTTVHLGVDSSQRITDTHQSVNLNRIASAEWNPSHQNHLQVSFNQVPQMTPKMKEISLKRKLSAISLERMKGAGVSVSLRGSSQISHLAGLSPTMRPVNINQDLIDFSIERSKELKADNQASSSNLRKMKENNNQHSPFIAGQAITLQSIAKQSDKSKKFSKRFKENGSMKSIRNLSRVGSNVRSSGSIKKSDRSGGKSPQKQQDPADWWRGGLADITDVAESKSATKHGTMGDFAKEINRDPKFKHNLPNLVSGVQSISQTKTILQVDLSEGQTPRGDNLTPFARSTGGHLGSNVQARQTQQESFDKNKLQTRHFESLASLRESLQEPDTHVRPSPYTSNHASQKSLKKHTLYRGTQRTSIAENNHLVQVMRNPGKDLQLEIPKMSGFQVNSKNIRVSPPLGEFSFKELIIPTVHYEAANGSHQKTFGSGGSPRRSPKGLGSSKAQQLGKKSPKVQTIQDVLNQYISQQTKQERKQQELDKYGPQKMKNYRKKVRNNAQGGQFYIHQTVINTKQKDRVFQQLEMQLSETNELSVHPDTAEAQPQINLGRNASQSSIFTANSVTYQDTNTIVEPSIQIEGQVVDIISQQKPIRSNRRQERSKLPRNLKAKIEVAGLNSIDKRGSGTLPEDTNPSSPYVIRTNDSPGELEAQREMVDVIKIVEQKLLGIDRQKSQSVLDQVHQFEAHLEGKPRSQSIIMVESLQNSSPKVAKDNGSLESSAQLAKEQEERSIERGPELIKIGSQVLKQPKRVSVIKNPKKPQLDEIINDQSQEDFLSKNASLTPWKGQTATMSPQKNQSHTSVKKLNTIKSKSSIESLKIYGGKHLQKDNEQTSNKDILQIMNLKGTPRRKKTLKDQDDQGTQILGAPISSVAGSSPRQTQESLMNIPTAIKTQFMQEVAPFTVESNSFDQHKRNTKIKSLLHVDYPNQARLQTNYNDEYEAGNDEQVAVVISELGNSQQSFSQGHEYTIDAENEGTIERQKNKIYDLKRTLIEEARTTTQDVDSTGLKLISQSESMMQSMIQTQHGTNQHQQQLGLPTLSARVVVGSAGNEPSIAVTFKQSPRGGITQDEIQLQDGQPTLQSETQSKKSERGDYQLKLQNQQANSKTARLNHSYIRNQVQPSLTTGETFAGNYSYEVSHEPMIKQAIAPTQDILKKPSFVTFQTQNRQMAQNRHDSVNNVPDYLTQLPQPYQRKRNTSQFQIYIKDKLQGLESGRLTPSLNTPTKSNRSRKIAPWNKKLTQIIGMSPLESQNMVDFQGPQIGSRRKSMLAMAQPINQQEPLSSQLSQKLRSMRVYSTLAHGSEGKQPQIDVSKAFRNFKPVRNHNEQLKYELGLLKDGQLPAKLRVSPSGFKLGAGTGAMLALRTKEITESLIERQRTQLIGKNSRKHLQIKHISLPKLKRQGIPLVHSPDFN